MVNDSLKCKLTGSKQSAGSVWHSGFPNPIGQAASRCDAGDRAELRLEHGLCLFKEEVKRSKFRIRRPSYPLVQMYLEEENDDQPQEPLDDHSPAHGRGHIVGRLRTGSRAAASPNRGSADGCAQAD
jgi:hypothetical protein